MARVGVIPKEGWAQKKETALTNFLLKKYLKIQKVGVIPNEGWARPRAAIPLLV